MIQLTHLGRRTSWSKGDWLPSISSGKHREPAHKAFPNVAEIWDIDRIIKEYGDAAERMKEGGMDGVELEGQGHLIGQFLSPLTNELETEYGGSFDNRLRFTIDVLTEIRKKVGKGMFNGYISMWMKPIEVLDRFKKFEKLPDKAGWVYESKEKHRKKDRS